MFGTDFEFLYKAKLLKFFILFCIAQFKLYLLVLCADVLEIFFGISISLLTTL